MDNKYQFILEISRGANMGILRTHFQSKAIPETPPRGEVRRFSAKARMRMLRTLNSIPLNYLDDCLFLTLTYHERWSDIHRDINTFWKRLARRYDGIWSIWRAECQKRGAPHFHLLLGGVDWLPHETVAKHWNEVVDGGAAHLHAGTSIERVRDGEGAKRYASKYMGKLDYHPCFPGRVWGVLGRRNLPKAETVQYILTEKEFYSVRRILQTLLKKRGYNAYRRRLDGVTVFISSDTVMEILECVKRQGTIEGKASKELYIDSGTSGVGISGPYMTRVIEDVVTA